MAAFFVSSLSFNIMIGKRIFAAFILIALFACTSKKKDTLFTLVENSNIDFVNTLEESKEYNVFKYRNFYNGGGVATGDINKNNAGTPLFFFTKACFLRNIFKLEISFV